MPKVIYVGMAALIALLAFGIGQVTPGYGTPFVMVASSLWVAYSIWRGRRYPKVR